MYRLGDKVKVINACAYHSWIVDTIAKGKLNNGYAKYI